MPDKILIVGCGASREHRDVSQTMAHSDGTPRDIGHRPHDLRGVTAETVDTSLAMNPTYNADFTHDLRQLLTANHYKMVKFEKVPFFILQGNSEAYNNAYHALESGGAVTIITGGRDQRVDQDIATGLRNAGFRNICIDTEPQGHGVFAAATKP